MKKTETEKKEGKKEGKKEKKEKRRTVQGFELVS
jgi:hypothetical protein